MLAEKESELILTVIAIIRDVGSGVGVCSLVLSLE
jgi:hypothetical protein